MKSIFQQLTLRTRITVSFVLLMITTMVIIIVAEQLDYDDLRAYAASESLRNDVSRIETELAGGLSPVIPENSQFYDSQTVPDRLRLLAPGYHSLTTSENKHLYVFESQNQRYYLLQAYKQLWYIDVIIDGFGPLIIIICILCAFWIGRLTSARITIPIMQLAEIVQRKEKPLPFLDAKDEIGILSRAFDKHSEDLERFLQRERCFAGDASHELRTPLAIISGAAEIIAHQLPCDSHLIISAERILRTTQEMQQQLSCLLLLSRDPHTLPRSKVPLRPIIEECAARCRPWLEQKPIRLMIDVPYSPHVISNAELVRSVIWNLLRNACQYTNEGEVCLVINGTNIVISDTGPGLPTYIDENNFKRFQHSAKENGEGLGLSIVQRIVEHLNWSMTVESSENGCRFALETCNG
ncbi:HAMP domain-containing histidine kinase [Klebsiella sp. CTHL.F3a]|nr:HAMP domain-containing histidine kinase [Klebsiella sp. CTHL.F3a]